ncbi:DUF6074 family protein [Neorhizobium sp. T786]|uniref:DUF6074 family protein n=1 Tax=Pseudorhizobium xiangyangii TaxID=2883104 RepID=UPI001CFF7566|nr:DUF6074 family protein [Neorhizobium xiangyangii]MCB5202377.1 DUF6074 family protein [Neorhizobium xiangyangii]
MTLVQFPSHRRTADVRRCAMILRDLHGEEANQFWRAEMSALVAALRRIGTCEEEVSLQVRTFMDAVQVELQLAFANKSAG